MRSMSSAMLAGILAPVLRPALFVSMEFLTGSAYAWTGVGNQSFNGHTYLGVGSLGLISNVEEIGTLEAKGVQLSLSGMDSSLLADALQEFKPGGLATIYLGLFDSGGSLISSPIQVWSGRMDQPRIEINGSTANITVSCESRLIDNRSAITLRYSQDTAQATVPGDLGFQFVNSIQQQNISWGAHPTSSPA